MDNHEIALSIISVTLLMLLLVAGIVIVIFLSGRQKIKQQMELSEYKLNYEKELRQAEMEVKEQTLGQLARELHDNIGQLLTAVHINLENQKLDHPELKDGFTPMETYLTEVMQHIKSLSRSLNNDYFGHIGLLASIDNEINRINSLRRFRVHWQPVIGNSNLDKDQELMVFRVFQEIIQNALRHSSAKNAIVVINNEGNNFAMKIDDDGKGFDVESIMQSQKASGLRNIIKRTKMGRNRMHYQLYPGQRMQY